ncbi:RHOMBOID-like protein 12, mitochondrial [Teratosphaeria destructans]|uniref:RHOMBOID-like protein 12, mitochondrial n=1 Tax=Teratosphaeria destructans TaxID=418781 RepID=A0A9W7T0S1_9PEZI|nr:RHOMBOID-like protein 12, mitochondrial [Teratosphaeria destructans]
MLASMVSRFSGGKMFPSPAATARAFSRSTVIHKPRRTIMNQSFFTSRASPRIPSSKSLLRRSFSSNYRLPNPGLVTSAIYVIISLNTAVFAAWQYATVTRDSGIIRLLEDHFLLSERNVKAGRYWTLVTSAFSHIHLWHFALNMMTFRTFATVLMWAGVGATQLVTLTMGSALLGSLSMLWHYRTRGRDSGSALGASDAVMGLGSAATCLMPNSRWSLMFIPISMPLWLLTGLYAGVDIYFLDSEISPIGHAAHLGGAMFGLVYYLAYLRNYGGIWLSLRLLLRR